MLTNVYLVGFLGKAIIKKKKTEPNFHMINYLNRHFLVTKAEEMQGL